MGYQDAGGAGLDAGLEGLEVLVLKGFVGAVVDGDAGVGVKIAAVAGEVLERGGKALGLHSADGFGNGQGGLFGGQAHGAGVDIIAGVGGDVADWGQV